MNINHILKQWHASYLKRNHLYSFSGFCPFTRLVTYASTCQRCKFNVVIYMLNKLNEAR